MFSLWKPLFLNRWLSSKLIHKATIALTLLTVAAIIIWFGGPEFAFHGYKPLYGALTRFYFIISIYLIWIIKFLLVDVETTRPTNPKGIEELVHLQYRFRDAMSFLKKTTTERQNKIIHLHELPWHLLIGPEQSGKTAFLAKADVNYILQKQNADEGNIAPSEHCDWWITPDASIIDVPSRYCTIKTVAKKVTSHVENYRYFLELVKAERGRQGIQGIFLALPLPEITSTPDHKVYTNFLHNVFTLLNETKKVFHQRIPINLIITKCDLLPGFATFFAESSREEINQAWGFQIISTPERRIYDIVTNRFNALIKKLNQQLLWRLHHERNPQLRPSIKDFPLQLERLKEIVLDFVRKYNHLQSHFPIQGIYLTSALQKTKDDTENTTLTANKIDGEYSTNNEVQLFQAPEKISHAYFIKQLLSQGLKPAPQAPQPAKIHWVKLGAYTTASAVVAISAFYMLKDFQYGMKNVTTMKSNIMDYQISTHTLGNSEMNLQKAVELLDILQAQAVLPRSTIDVSHLLKFYSYKSKLNVNTAYHKALQSILVPSLRNFFADTLKQPTNQTPSLIYATLQSYLMLGDKTHAQSKYIIDTLKSIATKNLSSQIKNELYQHLQVALAEQTEPVSLNTDMIKNARLYLTNLPTLQLAYVILKNNNALQTLDAANPRLLDPDQIVFTNNQPIPPIAITYTNKAFKTMIANIPQAVNASINGNWVLGYNANHPNDSQLAERMSNDLRELYIKDYVSAWENLIKNIELSDIEDLNSIDMMISRMTGKESPLLKLLQVIHDNSYFSPIVDRSEQLKNIDLMMEKSRENNNLLYQIFASLKSLHQYLQPALQSNDAKKASFTLVAARMKSQNPLDAITQLRLIATQSPEPINLWLTKITDETWNILIKSASQYIDTSWQNNVMQAYNHDIANRFPFNSKAKAEVRLQNFINFFGGSGIVMSYFHNYLQPFIDTSTDAWHWKIKDNKQIFLSEEKLRQIQYAIKIHHTFFPNNEANLAIQFTLQPYQFGKKVQNVKLKIGDKMVEGNQKTLNTSELITWPTVNHLTKLQLKIGNKTIESKNYDGEWGLFKLVNQYFETAVSKKQMVINFSMNDQPAKYLLITEGQNNPFMSFNLNHFNLPEHLN